VGTGTLTLTGANNITGGTTISGGTLVLNAPLTGNVVNNSVLAPQVVASQTTVGGTYAQTASGTLNLSLDKNAPTNAFTVGISAALAGTLSLDTSQIGSNIVGQQYTILTAPSIDRLFDKVDVEGPAAGLSFIMQKQTTVGPGPAATGPPIPGVTIRWNGPGG